MSMIAGVVPAAVVFSAAAGMTAAGMTAAGMTFVVVMMVAMEIRTNLQGAVEQSFHHRAHIPFRAADDFDSRAGKCIDRTPADSAADQKIHPFPGEKSRQRTVSGIAAGKDLFRNDFSILHIKKSKFRRMTEMLKDLTVFTGDCNFQIHFLFLLIVL